MRKTKTLLNKVCEAIESKKGGEVTILDVSKISSFTDFFSIFFFLRVAQFPLPIGFNLCLTAQTKRRPGYGFQPFSFDLLPAIHALAEVPFIEPT